MLPLLQLFRDAVFRGCCKVAEKQHFSRTHFKCVIERKCYKRGKFAKIITHEISWNAYCRTGCICMAHRAPWLCHSNGTVYSVVKWGHAQWQSKEVYIARSTNMTNEHSTEHFAVVGRMQTPFRKARRSCTLLLLLSPNKQNPWPLNRNHATLSIYYWPMHPNTKEIALIFDREGI